MNNIFNWKIVSAILVSTLLGAFIGFGLSYLFFNSHIQNLNSNVESLENTIDMIGNSVSSIKNNVTTMKNNISSIENTVTNLQDNLITIHTDIAEFGSNLSDVEVLVDIFQVNLVNVETELGKAQSDITNLNSALEEIETREWHLIFSETSNFHYFTRIKPKGDNLRIVWSMTGTTNSKIEIKLYFHDNGSLFYSTGSSGIYGSYAVELQLEYPKDYSLWILTENVDWWIIEVFDYY
jgi:hypothetical protein